MMLRVPCLLGALTCTILPLLHAQGGPLTVPQKVEAGSAFSIQTAGSGKGVLYLVGLGQVLRRDVQLGEPIAFTEGALHNAGRYRAILVTPSSTDSQSFDVAPAAQVADVSFLAKPSRLPVGLHDGISGAVYLFDAYKNLVTAPTTVSFQLAGVSSSAQTRNVVARNGYAWTQMDSATKEGAAQFVAHAGSVSAARVIQQVPGDPCGLRLSVRPLGQKVALQTEPLRDCGGNAVPDGTIVTFTESFQGSQTTVDVPLKHGVAQAELPAYAGARISAATGVVMGNEIRLGK